MKREIKEGDKVQIKGQKERHIYEVGSLAPVSGLALLNGYKRAVKVNRLILAK